jgi:hypothetical protein
LTDAELLGLARQVLNIAKTEFELNGEAGFIMASYHANHGIHRTRSVEALLHNMLGENWLDDGDKKDYAFDVIRYATQQLPPDAVVFCTPCNVFKPTTKFEALPVEERHRLVMRSKKGHDEDHKMVAEGWLALSEAFNVVVQTPQRVCICSQEVRRGVLVGQPRADYFKQDDFHGRLKMFALDAEERKHLEELGERLKRAKQ